MRSVVIVYILFLVFVLFHKSLGFNRINLITSVDQYMNLCPLGKYHKDKPSKEPELSNDCSSWSSLSCCNSLIFEGIANKSLYNFTHSHCGSMSEKCQQVFKKDLCFYECSPNLGPWLVKVNRKISSERMFNVPLCQSECNYWWDSCKSDRTCVTNWHIHFNWSTGTNTCPTNSSCDTIQSIFGNAKTFCESIWDDGWKVVPDDTVPSCMIFNERKEISVVEHNRLVTQKRAIEIIDLLNGTLRCTVMKKIILLLLFLVMARKL